jgi:hypothetical protein
VTNHNCKRRGRIIRKNIRFAVGDWKKHIRMVLPLQIEAVTVVMSDSDVRRSKRASRGASWQRLMKQLAWMLYGDNGSRRKRNQK